MSSLPFLNNLASQLHRSGIPTDYIQRVVGELADHRDDIAGASDDDVETRLGHPSQLAEQFVSQYRLRSCFSRHPLITLLLAPLVTTHIAMLIYYFALVIVLCLLYETVLPELGLDPYSGPASVVLAGMATWFHRMGLVVPFALAAIVVSRLGLAVGRGRRWSYFAIAIQTVILLFCAASLHLPCGRSDTAILEVCFPAIVAPSGAPTIGMLTRLGFGLAPIIMGASLLEFWYRCPDRFTSQDENADPQLI